MKTYRFSCARRDVETGKLEQVDGLLTPPVEAETPTMAIFHQDTVSYCDVNNCSVYRMVT